jgi:hypothetical protein
VLRADGVDRRADGFQASSSTRIATRMKCVPTSAASTSSFAWPYSSTNTRGGERRSATLMSVASQWTARLLHGTAARQPRCALAVTRRAPRTERPLPVALEPPDDARNHPGFSVPQRPRTTRFAAVFSRRRERERAECHVGARVEIRLGKSISRHRIDVVEGRFVIEARFRDAPLGGCRRPRSGGSSPRRVHAYRVDG